VVGELGPPEPPKVLPLISWRQKGTHPRWRCRHQTLVVTSLPEVGLQLAWGLEEGGLHWEGLVGLAR
jgi:hypothetical protein